MLSALFFSVAACASVFGQRTVAVSVVSTPDQAGAPRAIDFVWAASDAVAAAIDGPGWFEKRQAYLQEFGTDELRVDSYELVPAQSVELTLEAPARSASLFIFVSTVSPPSSGPVRRYDRGETPKQLNIILSDDGIEVTPIKAPPKR